MNLSLCCYPPLPPPPPPSSVKVPRSVTSSLTSRPSWSLKDLIRRFSVNPALVFQAIRCTQPSCPCECFAPGKACLRYCETCNHGWVAHALDKLGYQQAYNLGMQVEVVQPNIVFDIASLMLYGAQATPVRLKILLDRLLSVLQHEEVLQVLHGFGWSYEDYARGYILQDSNGHVLDKWSMATRDEEHVILQQFLRFGETKAIAQEIILQDTRDKQDAYSKQTTRAESEIKKFIERSNLSMQSFMKLDPSRQMFAGRLPFVPSGARLLTSPIITPSPYSPSRDNAVRPLSLTTSPAASSTPLSTPPINRLQAYEFRRELASSASPAPSPSSSSDKVTLATSLATGMSVPTVVSSMAAITGRRSPVLESPRNLSTTPSSVHSAPSPCVTPHKSQVLESGELSAGFSDSDDEQSMGAIDYSTRDSISPHDPDRKISAAAAAAARHHRKSSNPIKRHWIPSANFGHTLIGPNGKKRVLCTACNKTFCDKGALKIHYSAVHLKEMHKCSVEGCNMMFSSRRSRNRHSANPNPKLHMPQKRKELEGLDDEGEPICSLSSLTTSLSSTLSSSPTMVVAPGLVAAHRSLEAGGLLRADPSYFMELGAQFPFAAPPGKRIKLESQEAPTDLSGGSGSEKGKDNEEEKGAPSESAATPGSHANDNETKDTENMEVEMETDVTADGDDTAKSDIMTQRQGGNRRKSNAPTRFAQKDEPVIVSEDHSHNQERSQLPINPFSARPTEESRIIAEADTANGSQMQQQPQDTASAEEGQTSGDNKQGTGAIHFPQIASLLLASKEQREDGEEDDDDSDENELVINGDVDDRDDEEEGEERDEEGEEAATYDDNDHNHNTVSREDGGEDGESCESVPSPSSDGGTSLEVSSEVYLAKDNPRKCALCGKLFQNQFSVKIHFQNVHLKLMHGCTVDGCTAAFPSKRSRDRHSSNLNLHRKLMSGGESGLDSSADPTLRDDILSTLYGATQLVAVAATAAAKSGGALNLQAINSNGSEEVAELKGTATLPASDSVETSQPIGAAALPPTETDDDEAKTDKHSAETEMTQNGGNGHSSEQTEEQGEQEEAEEEEEEEEEEAQGNTDSTAAGNKEDEADKAADKAEDKPAPTGRREEPMCISRKPVCCGMTFHTESALKEHYDLSHPSQPIKTGHTAATETLLASRRSRPRHKNGLHRLVSTGRKNGFS